MVGAVYFSKERKTLYRIVQAFSSFISGDYEYVRVFVSRYPAGGCYFGKYASGESVHREVTV